MIKILFTLITVLLFAACSTTTSSDVPFRAKTLDYNRYAGVYHAGLFTSIVHVDSLYLPGDTIRIDNMQAYVLIERMK